MKRVIIAAEVNNIPSQLYNRLNWFIGSLGAPLTSSDLSEVDRMWGQVQPNTKKELRGYLNTIYAYCIDTQLTVDEAYDDSDDIAADVEALVKIIRGIVRQNSKYIQ